MPKLSRGQVAGFAALGLLVVLTAVALLSARQGRTSVPPDVSQPEVAAPATANDIPAEPAAPSAPADPAAGRRMRSQPEPHSKGSTITAVAEDIMLSPKARLLAERLLCVCGCNDILATCTCAETPGSHDMKKYLQQLVDQGKNPIEVEEAMIARYGKAVKP